MPENTFKSGFVSIIGRPNVGKSTLLNAILGEKVSIVSDKPQTTRNRILGISTHPGTQVIFIDTPGIHKPKHKLNEYMVKTALHTLDEVDIVLYMTEAGESIGGGDRYIIERLQDVKKPVLLLINKIDLVQKGLLLPLIDEFSRLYNFVEIFPVSALRGDNVSVLYESIVSRLPEGPQYFPDDAVTDQPMRFIAAELVREKIFQLTYEEIPYSIAVGIEEFGEDKEKNMVFIRAVIFVDKDSQKGIVIGKGGTKLKKVGQLAREELEAIMGIKVFLELWVKVKSGWRGDDMILRMLGYKI
ncbi:MAG: GTPase Era [Nitrospirae bacterium]|nr:GTPase Era [Nitrospirota bacterium]